MTNRLPCIKGFRSNSLLDWPGRLSAIMFLPNCNFRCPFCHSGDLAKGTTSLPDLSFEKIAGVLNERSSWIDGVVVTGGEPTLWGQKLVNLLTEIKKLGFGVKLDTNGTNPDLLHALIEKEFVDAVHMDVKGPIDERYKTSCGCEFNPDDIKRSIALLRDSAIEVEFRTTVCPSIHSVEDIADTAREIAGEDTVYVLQAFRPVDECLDPELRNIKQADQRFMEAAANAAARWTPKVTIRGRFDFHPAKSA